MSEKTTNKTKLRPDIVMDYEAGAPITNDMISKGYKKMQEYLADYDLLEDYYLGTQNVPEDIEVPVIDNKCDYITDLIVGYMSGIQPQVQVDNSNESVALMESLDTMSFLNRVPDILHEMSLFGRTFVLLYHDVDESKTPKMATYDPRKAWVVYDREKEPSSIYGAIITPTDGKTEIMTVYTDTEVIEYLSENGEITQELGRSIHRFGRVPLVEFRNNTYARGDFEPILSLQDASNFLLSYRQDDKQTFSMATLIVIGQILGMKPSDVEEKLKSLKRTPVLQFPDSNSSAQFLTHTFDETSLQTFQDRIDKSIFINARVPNLGDEAFASNSSGVAMAYKLMGTDTLAGHKGSEFNKAFRYFIKCVASAGNNPIAVARPEIALNIDRVSVAFKWLTPSDLSVEGPIVMQMVQAGLMSKRTAMIKLGVADDIDVERDNIAKEQEEDDARLKAIYEGDMTINAPEEVPPEDEEI